MLKNPSKVQQTINYYFELKGWANKEKDYCLKRKILYGRFTRPAKELLSLCDNDVEIAKQRLKKIKQWAESKGLNWGIETVIKRWFIKDEYDSVISAFELKVAQNKKRYGL